MAGFADVLAPPPPPPLGLSGVLSSLLGGDPTGAYLKGQTAGSEYRLRSAQTESALAEADKRRTEALRQTQINDAISKAQSDPHFQPDMPFYAALAANANDLSNAALHNQEFGRNALIADPNADPAAVSAARAASAPGSYQQYYQPATGMIANNAVAAAPTVTPVGEAQITSDIALAGERNRSPTSAAGVAPLVRSSGGVSFKSFDKGQTWAPIAATTDLAAAAAATAAGKATGQKQAALYSNLNNIDAFTGTIDELLAHPGFSTIYGMSSALDPRNAIPGTDAQGAKALRDQLTSRAFLVSIQAMRGMGQLSNQEGAKVETALTAAMRPGLSDEEAALRLMQLKDSVLNLRAVAEQEASATENALTPATTSVDPRVKQYADQYLGGDVAKATDILRKRGAIP